LQIPVVESVHKQPWDYKRNTLHLILFAFSLWCRTSICWQSFDIAACNNWNICNSTRSYLPTHRLCLVFCAAAQVFSTAARGSLADLQPLVIPRVLLATALTIAGYQQGSPLLVPGATPFSRQRTPVSPVSGPTCQGFSLLANVL